MSKATVEVALLSALNWGTLQKPCSPWKRWRERQQASHDPNLARLHFGIHLGYSASFYSPYPTYPPILSPPFLLPTLRKLHRGLPRPHTAQCVVFIFGELSRALFQTREVCQGMCSYWLPLSLSNSRGQCFPILDPWCFLSGYSYCCHVGHPYSQLAWPSLLSSLLWGRGRPQRWRANCVCFSLSHDSDFGRLRGW